MTNTLNSMGQFGVVWLTLLENIFPFAGDRLGESFEQIGRWRDPITKVVLGGLIAWYLWRVLRVKHDHDHERRAHD